MRSVEPLTLAGGGAIVVELTLGLPGLIVDRMAVRQIRLTLVANSLQHVGAGAHLTVRTGGVTGGETWLEVGDRGPGLPASVVAHLMRGTGPDALRAFSSTGQAGSACGSRVRWRRKTAAASRSPTPVRRGRACGSSSAPAGRCRCEPGNWATNRETRRFVSASHGKNRRFSAPFRRRCHRLLAGRPRPPARPLWPIRNVA